MTNRVILNRLVFCKDCGSRESWERYPEKDMHTYTGDLSNPTIGGIFEYAYKCRVCGALTWYPYEPELKVLLTGDARIK